MYANETYHVTAATSLNIAGYTISDATLTLADPLTVTFTLDVPQIGNVDFNGSYDSALDQWSLSGQLHDPSLQPISLGPLALSNMSFLLNGSGMTVTATAGVPAIPSLGSEMVALTIGYDGTLDGIFLPNGSNFSLDGFNLTQGEIDFHYDPASGYTLSARGGGAPRCQRDARRVRQLRRNVRSGGKDQREPGRS